WRPARSSGRGARRLLFRLALPSVMVLFVPQSLTNGKDCRGSRGIQAPRHDLGKRRQSARARDSLPNMSELIPTPNDCPLPRRCADFATFNEALDYAALSQKGLNFHDARGQLERVYPYRELREDALAMAHRLIAAGVGKGDRVALVAETGPEFAALFCGAVYAGAWPVPLPLPTTFGGKENYIEQLTVQISSADPKLLLYPAEIAEMVSAAAARQGCQGLDWNTFAAHDAPEAELPKADPDDICYLQYS